MREWQIAVHEAWGGNSPYTEMLIGLGCIVGVHALVRCVSAIDGMRWKRLLSRAREEQLR